MLKRLLGLFDSTPQVDTARVRQQDAANQYFPRDALSCGLWSCDARTIEEADEAWNAGRSATFSDPKIQEKYPFAKQFPQDVHSNTNFSQHPNQVLSMFYSLGKEHAMKGLTTPNVGPVAAELFTHVELNKKYHKERSKNREQADAPRTNTP